MKRRSDGQPTAFLSSGVSASGASVFYGARVNWTHWFGFATILIWIYGLFWSTTFSSLAAQVSVDFLSIRAQWLGVEALMLFILFLALRFKAFLHFPVAQYAAGIATAAGSGILIWGIAQPGFPAFLIGGVLASGLGSAVLLVLWGSALASQGSQSLLFSIGISFFIASFSDVVFMHLPVIFQIASVIGMPIVAVVLLRLALKRQGASSAPLVLHEDAFGNGETSLFWRMLFLPLLVGLSYGLMQRLTLTGGQFAGPSADLLTISTFFATGLVTLVTALLFTKGRLLRLTYFIVLPLMVTAFAVFPLSEAHYEAIQAVFMVGFNCFYLIVWAFWSDSWKGQKFSLERRFSIGLFILVASESLGSVLGSFLVDSQTDSRLLILAVSLAAVYLLMMGALFSAGRFLGKRSDMAERQQEAGKTLETKNPVLDGSTILSAQAESALWLDACVDTYKLSRREQEVLLLLVKGRNRASISKTLYISDNTTRTHMKNIYRKMGVHSHQELLDIIEGNMAQGVN
jgi:DNA-binding CsgD family transcriptional regulator